MSTVKTNNVQIGQSATATNNFTWYQPASPDGTVRLGVGNSGATSSDVVTANSSGNVGIGTSSPISYTNQLSLSVNSASSYARLDLLSGGSHKAYFVANATEAQFGTQASIPILINVGGTERMRIDTSGNVGIGTSSPSTNLHIYGATNSQIRLQNASNSHYVGNISGSMEIQSADIIKFLTGGANERARIDTSGNLLVGTTATDPIGSQVRGLSYRASISNLTLNSLNGDPVNIGLTGVTGTLVNFGTNGSVRGSISTNGSTVSYNTSSDYRLKENVQPMVGALAKVQALKPVTYVWKATGESGEGFIAHELQAVCPDAVTGEKDAVNEDGSIKPQGIDTSFLVATLTAAIQELKGIVEQQAARIAALEAASANS